MNTITMPNGTVIPEIDITIGSRQFITDFERWEHLKEYAYQNALTIHILQRRDGGEWIDGGLKYTPLTSEDYIKDLGDEYHELYSDEGIGWKEYLHELVNRLSDDPQNVDFEKLLTTISNIQEIIDKSNEAELNEVVIVRGKKYFETVPCEMLSYHEDVTTYQMAVLFNS